MVLFARGLNVIDWLPSAIANVWLTGAAGRKAASPGCDAVIVQEPTEANVTVAPTTVQPSAAV